MTGRKIGRAQQKNTGPSEEEEEQDKSDEE
jgi:hypothetical protein